MQPVPALVYAIFKPYFLVPNGGDDNNRVTAAHRQRRWRKTTARVSIGGVAGDLFARFIFVAHSLNLLKKKCNRRAKILCKANFLRMRVHYRG
jgi:hypothetical protein